MASVKNEVTKMNPNFKMIGEYWGAGITNDGGYLGTGQMDSLLDFEFKEKQKHLLTVTLTKLRNIYRNEMNF